MDRKKLQRAKDVNYDISTGKNNILNLYSIKPIINSLLKI